MNKSGTDIKLQVNIHNRQILQIALPISVSIFVPQVNYVTNNIFLGALGEKELAVAGITGVYYLIFAVIGFGLNNGLQALISRRAGENRISEIGDLFSQGVRIALVFAALSIAITFLISPAILQLALHDEEHVQMALGFLYIRIWGLPFLYIYQMRNALLVGVNQSKFLVYGTLAETLTNIALDYCLIYGHFGLPAMGFNGAALASVVAEITGLVVIFGIMWQKGISKRLQLFRSFKFNTANTKLILIQSSPLILQFVISVASWEFFYILIEHHGERDLAISNAMRNVFGMFGCISWAFAATSNSMVSNIIGQGLHHRVKELILKITKLSMGFSIIVFTLLNLAPGFLLQIYGQGDDFILAAIPVVRVVSSALIFMAVATVWLNAVTGTGNTTINLIIEIAAIILYSIYAYIVLEKLRLPITWGWAAELLYWTSIFIPSFLYIQSGRWKHKKI